MNILRFAIFLVLAFFTNFLLFAGQVEVVKGKVTVLLPHETSAKNVEVGMTIPEDSSLLTQEKSFVKIRLEDGSTINLGSNSKMVVEKIKNGDEPSSITLLKGKLRAQVEKGNEEEKDKVKMVVKNNSSSMGVRGTDFLVVFNPDTKASSLITFEGKVAIVKPVADISLVEQLQKTDKAVSAGEFSGINEENLKQPLKKYKVSEQQIKLLKENTDLTDEKGNKADSKTIKDDGKLVDFKTALAVPSDSGFVNMKTGDFTPLDNLDLTTHGFVPLNKENDESILLSNRFNSAITGRVFKESQLAYWFDIYSLRSNLATPKGDIIVKDNVIFRNNFKYSYGDLTNNYYGKISLMSVKFDSLGCTSCGNGINGSINDGLYKEFDAGYEHRFNKVLNAFVEVGTMDRPTTNGNNVDKEMAQKLSLGGKAKLVSDDTVQNLYPYLKAQIDVINMNEGLGIGWTTGLGFDLKAKGNLGVYGEVFIGRESDKGISNQTGGLGFGINYSF